MPKSGLIPLTNTPATKSKTKTSKSASTKSGKKGRKSKKDGDSESLSISSSASSDEDDGEVHITAEDVQESESSEEDEPLITKEKLPEGVPELGAMEQVVKPDDMAFTADTDRPNVVMHRLNLLKAQDGSIHKWYGYKNLMALFGIMQEQKFL